MAGASVAKIAVGSPHAGATGTGGILVAPAGTTLPVGVVAAATGFTALGYVGDDGLRPAGERTSTPIKDWAGDEIYRPQENHSAAFQVKLLQYIDADVQREVHGTDNVTQVGSLITVHETGEPLGVHPWIFDMRDGVKRERICIPAGQITASTEGAKVNNSLMSYDVTVTCYKDDAGIKVYRYLDDGSSPAAPTVTAVDPSSLATAGGQVIEVTGTGFSGTTGVTIDGAGVAFNVISSTKLAVVSGAEAAGDYNLVVTNATGPSAAFEVTYV
jgi:hypothetical protein